MDKKCLKIYLDQEEIDAIKALLGTRPVSYFECDEWDSDMSIMFAKVDGPPENEYPLIDISIMPIDENMDANKLAPLAQLICHAIDNLRRNF